MILTPNSHFSGLVFWLRVHEFMASEDLDALGTHFNDPTFTLLAKRYPEYQKRRSACYH
jgi:hypothetical protein